MIDHTLHGLPKYGDGIGLHRVRFLMEACGLDPDVIATKAIAVTGSNGKGSTARIAAELLLEAGGPVGLFTSPHLYRYNERFRIDGEPVDDVSIEGAMDRVLRAVQAWRSGHDDAVGAFEAQFVVALELLRQCRWLVLEAGIGGRYDPVRLAHAPVSALVSLDLEHTELLGQTRLEIACDKLDATARGGIAVVGPDGLPLRQPLSTYAELTGIGLRFLAPNAWRQRGLREGRQLFDIGMVHDLTSSLVGEHQIANHAVALALVEERLRLSGCSPLSQPGVRVAISRVSWPGRLETISRDPLVVIDVGHTPEGVQAALSGFRALSTGRKALLVTGGSRNKNVRAMLDILVPAFDAVCCTAAHHNGLPASEVADLVRALRPGAGIAVCNSIAEAARHVRGLTPDVPVYVAGGLFLAAEFAEAWRGGDPSELRFF